MSNSIDKLNLSRRALHFLTMQKVKTLDELLRLNIHDLNAIVNLGENGRKGIVRALKEKGLELSA